MIHLFGQVAFISKILSERTKKISMPCMQLYSFQVFSMGSVIWDWSMAGIHYWLTDWPLMMSCVIYKLPFCSSPYARCDSFCSVYQLLRSEMCPYFYICAHHLTILFRAKHISGHGSIHALLGPTTRGFRESLKAEGEMWSIGDGCVKKAVWGGGGQWGFFF